MCRYKNGRAFSSAVGASVETTWKKRGSIWRIMAAMRLPLPEVPQPSTSTMTGRSFCLTESCSASIRCDRRRSSSFFSSLERGDSANEKCCSAFFWYSIKTS